MQFPANVPVGVWLLLALYFLPWLLAVLNRRRQKGAIFALNLLLGWTVLGWIGAFVWACVKDT